VNVWVVVIGTYEKSKYLWVKIFLMKSNYQIQKMLEKHIDLGTVESGVYRLPNGTKIKLGVSNQAGKKWITFDEIEDE